MAVWLRHCNNYYEVCKSQSYVSDTEPAKPWMVVYDIIVDAVFEWYDWRSKQKKNEQATQSHEAQVPHAKDHENTYTARHR